MAVEAVGGSSDGERDQYETTEVFLVHASITCRLILCLPFTCWPEVTVMVLMIVKKRFILVMSMVIESWR